MAIQRQGYRKIPHPRNSHFTTFLSIVRKFKASGCIPKLLSKYNSKKSNFFWYGFEHSSVYPRISSFIISKHGKSIGTEQRNSEISFKICITICQVIEVYDWDIEGFRVKTDWQFRNLFFGKHTTIIWGHVGSIIFNSLGWWV